HYRRQRYSPGPDAPAMSISWYDGAAYCNWLSEREGIPPEQWCYEPNAEGNYAPGMRMKAGHLGLTGYRLPTEGGGGVGCRAGAAWGGGAVTAGWYGRGEEVLPRYGWFLKNSDDRTWRVGLLRPNELGLFDVLGNVSEWCEDPGMAYVTGQTEDVEHGKYLQVN